MDAHQLSLELKKHYGHFVETISQLTDEQFIDRPANKWTAGQHTDHLLRSVKPVLMAMKLPAVLLRILFGKANRPSKTYEELVTKYKSKLLLGGRAFGRFVPAAIRLEQRIQKQNELVNIAGKLAAVVETMPEEKLDNYILPHPLLGKLTLREMLYFTIYHADHHENNVRRDLELGLPIPGSSNQG